MPYVALREGESGENLLNRFRASVARSGLLKEVKARRFFVSKSEKARIAARRSARRWRRKSSS